LYRFSCLKPLLLRPPLSSRKIHLALAAAVIAVVAGIIAVAGPSLAPAYRTATTSGENPRGARAVVVARNFPGGLPAGLVDLSVGDRKRVFVETVLPLVLRENERIRASRSRLLALDARRTVGGGGLSADDRAWLDGLAEKYQVSADDADELARRIDAVPPSLAIAQAAEESGWGTSRFARLGNALFGQWTRVPGEGMVPLGRDEDARHEVKVYQALAESVRDYMHNLNTHPAYEDLRRLRAEMRRAGRSPAGHDLSIALVRYSARGENYVRSLRTIIRVNRFGTLDTARLDPPRA
jgi:Bax protein